MTERDDLVFIGHILESIKAIEEFSKEMNEKELETNRLKQSAIIREIEIIGEASKNLSREFRENNREIAWKNISGTRDIIIHKYFGVDTKEIWNIITKDIPVLKKHLIKIKSKL